MAHHSGTIPMLKYKTGESAHSEIDADGLVLTVNFVSKVIEESDNRGLL